MSSALALQLCRLVTPEKLHDRFLTSGILTHSDNHSLKDQVVIAYIFEITKPMFSSGKVLPALLETLENEQKKLSARGNLDTQFELLLKEVNQALNAVSESGETDWIGSLNGIIMALSHDEVHFSQTGRCPAYILQNNRIRQITDDPQAEYEPHPLKTFSNLASGHLQENDQILLANQELYHEISLDALRRILNTASPHQASLAIARELKKQKNPAVASLIMKVTDTQASTTEPQEVLLEEEMQSNLMKFRKKLSPAADALKTFSTKVGQASLETAKQTHAVVKEKVAPKAEELWHKSTENAKVYAEQLSHKIKDKAHTEHHADHPVEESTVIEVVRSKKHSEVYQRQDIAKAAEERLEHTFGEEEEEIIAVTDSAPESWQNRLKALLKRAKLLSIMALGKLMIWLKVPKNRKNAALGIAIILIVATIWGALGNRGGQPSAESNVANAQVIQEVTELNGKITTAVDLEQDIEAARLVEDAQKRLLNLKDPTDEQQTAASQLWQEISVKADSLNKAVRLTAASATYPLPGNATGVMSMLPYFYGWGKDNNALLRTGKGEPTQVEDTINLPSSTDTIISVARSSEAESVSYALTKHNKVYRILQNGETTTLREVTTKSGEFDVGDAIGSFASNIYILDGKSGLLWRYINAGTGTYNTRESVIDITQYDIKHGISLAIDGAIYILKDDDSLLKFVRGRQDTEFALKDMPQLSRDLIKPLQVVTSETIPSIYILDGGTTTANHSTAKILEFNKSGSYIRQYTFPADCTDVRAFDINPNEKKLWILNGSEIKEFDL